jgi:phthiodiolone/phenolphthiodiolone dimycocerosates ketoreductase
VTTSIPLISDRFSPPSTFTAYARAAEASGVVDELLVWDQMSNFWPRQLWRPEHTPLAAVVPDIDSYADAFAVSAHVLASSPSLGIAVSTDAVRRGPAELFQTLLTLQNMTRRRATLMIGAGEVKQLTPFGWNRAEGLDRLADQLKLFRDLWSASGPIDAEGNFWNLRQAWMGCARGPRPQLWALGGGPKLLDLGTSYADGMAAIVPSVFPTPQAFTTSLKALKADLERKGRDPEQFEFGLWFMALVHEDPEVIRRAMAGKFLRWMAGISGRIEMAAWRREGLTPPMPEDWHYATRLLPAQCSDTQVEELLAGVSDEIVERSYVHGNPREVANQVQPYVDAGATWIGICDLLPFVLNPADTNQPASRTIEVCGHLKAFDSRQLAVVDGES